MIVIGLIGSEWRRQRSGVQSQESIAHIAQAQQQSEQCFETALTKIEKAAAAAPPLKLGVVAETELATEKPTVKHHCTIQPTDFLTATYLETQQDVVQFIAKLKARLDPAVTSGQRIRIK